MDRAPTQTASLEALIESSDLGIESLHPGGLALTRELAEMCWIGRESRVLDVASGTGEAACYLVEQFGCAVTGLDAAPGMVERARKKAAGRGLAVEFREGDAQELPFPNASFDVVICECTLCALDKERTLAEMHRVLQPGGYAGIHDLCWHGDAPKELKQQLVDLESERPETLKGWKQCFERAGFSAVTVLDRSAIQRAGMEQISRALGIGGRLRISLTVLQRWGIRGLVRVLRSERLFRNPLLGYAMVTGHT